MPSAEGALEAAETDRLFARLERFARLAVAVSGGPDSTALLTLLAEWRARRTAAPAIVVLTVDHALRPEARLEADGVARRAERLGLPHEILTWTGAKPSANLQDAARRARYRLLADAARRHGADALVTAHTLDDQAETFLVNLARGSGIYGLAAMPAERRLGALALVRPLLDVPKARLVAGLEARGLDWFEDPSNRDDRFRRVAARRALRLLAPLGLGADRLAATAARMARAAAAVDAAADAVLERGARLHPAGFARLDAAGLDGAAEEVRLRALARLLAHAGGAGRPPRLERLERLAAAVAGDPAPWRRTLAGALVERRADGIWFRREPGRAGLPQLRLAPGGAVVWDGRFLVALAAQAPGPVSVAALGRDARAVVRDAPGAPPGFALAAAAAVRAGPVVVAAAGLEAPATPWRPLVSIDRIAPGEAWLHGADGAAGEGEADGAGPADDGLDAR